MPPGEHIHIISAGENIHIAYPAAIRSLPTITRTYVFADNLIYEISRDPEVEKGRMAVRKAVSAVKEISASLSIPFSYDLVYPPAYPAVRDMLTKIRREHPDARFTFDLSGGSKPLCMALLAFAPWLDGGVSAAFDEKTPRSVPLPDRSVRTLLANPNYQTILAMLLRPGKHKPEAGIYQWVAREYLYKQLWSVYTPSRTKKPKPSDSPAQPVTYKRGRKPAAELTHGTFSDFMQALTDAGLVTQEISMDPGRQKGYRITESGEIAFRFFSNPETSTLVRTVLEK
jgi:hypothetical protein